MSESAVELYKNIYSEIEAFHNAYSVEESELRTLALELTQLELVSRHHDLHAELEKALDKSDEK